MNLARRSFTSLSWQVAANTLKLVVSLGRSVLLARWLPIEVFGVYVAARAIVAVTQTLPDFGMRGAFLHRASQVEDESRAAGVHFTLKLITTTVWMAAMLVFALLFSSANIRPALILIVATAGLSHLTRTPALILERRVVHRRLALAQALTAILTALVSLPLAWFAWTRGEERLALWALLSTHVVMAVVDVFTMYVWRPVWRPRLAWDKQVARYFLRFGTINSLSTFLYQLLEKVDDIWVKVYLGDRALGFYSRAYTFATYPRELLARPLNKVLPGTYAEMKGDRRALSKAFFQSNALLVRSSFLLGGGFILVAPEFVEIVLTDKWLPMLDAMRLMIVFAMLDPLKGTVSNLMIALGDASRPIPSRIVQLIVLGAGLYYMGGRWGIEGVAIAVNTMTVVGIAILYSQARRYVDFSLRQLFLVPCIAVAAGLSLSQAAVAITNAAGFGSALLKMAVFAPVTLSVLFVFERRQMKDWIDTARKMVQ